MEKNYQLTLNLKVIKGINTFLISQIKDPNCFLAIQAKFKSQTKESETIPIEISSKEQEINISFNFFGKMNEIKRNPVIFTFLIRSQFDQKCSKIGNLEILFNYKDNNKKIWYSFQPRILFNNFLVANQEIPNSIHLLIHSLRSISPEKKPQNLQIQKCFLSILSLSLKDSFPQEIKFAVFLDKKTIFESTILEESTKSIKTTKPIEIGLENPNQDLSLLFKLCESADTKHILASAVFNLKKKLQNLQYQHSKFTLALKNQTQIQIQQRALAHVSFKISKPQTQRKDRIPSFPFSYQKIPIQNQNRNQSQNDRKIHNQIKNNPFPEKQEEIIKQFTLSISIDRIRILNKSIFQNPIFIKYNLRLFRKILPIVLGPLNIDIEKETQIQTGRAEFDLKSSETEVLKEISQSHLFLQIFHQEKLLGIGSIMFEESFKSLSNRNNSNPISYSYSKWIACCLIEKQNPSINRTSLLQISFQFQEKMIHDNSTKISYNNSPKKDQKLISPIHSTNQPNQTNQQNSSPFQMISKNFDYLHKNIGNYNLEKVQNMIYWEINLWKERENEILEKELKIKSKNFLLKKVVQFRTKINPVKTKQKNLINEIESLHSLLESKFNEFTNLIHSLNISKIEIGKELEMKENDLISQYEKSKENYQEEKSREIFRIKTSFQNWKQSKKLIKEKSNLVDQLKQDLGISKEKQLKLNLETENLKQKIISLKEKIGIENEEKKNYSNKLDLIDLRRKNLENNLNQIENKFKNLNNFNQIN
ncbi:hypothetical protein M0811_08200 [Anaeramoeba ignava]|uniref:Uncharacterized protein n=1 Tax=Anaeramoeba ignava TaxID=1746090 RepID=A0A9Q0LJE1_ANAIG|nr:hypothetical protein M0811_08200 [Anaeramoeba ignava]